MPKDLTQLSGLNSLEVSLVERGANKKKRFPIFKQEDQMDHEFEEILKAVLETEVDEETDLEEWFAKAKVSPKGMAAVKSALRMLSAYKDELPKDALDKLAAAAGYPSPKAAQQEEEEEDKYKYPEAKSKDKIKKWLDSMPEELRKTIEYTEPKEEEPVHDKLPEEVQAVLKAREDELKAIKAENEKITKALEVERDKRELEEWTAKAEKELSHYPGKSTEELGKMLKDLHDANPEVAKVQFDSMKAASEAIKKSALLAERGSVGGVSQSGSAWEKICKMADGLVEKSTDVNFTREAAIAKVLDMRPDLYSEYLDEHPRQTAPLL
jgi:hypothetical protein